jgi:cobalamin biosynthesis Mg chelatase CobN
MHSFGTCLTCESVTNRIFGAALTDDDLNSYLEAYFGDRLSKEHRDIVISNVRKSNGEEMGSVWYDDLVSFLDSIFGSGAVRQGETSDEENLITEAQSIATLLTQSTEELTSVVAGLNGGYIKPAPGGGKLYRTRLAEYICSYF